MRFLLLYRLGFRYQLSSQAFYSSNIDKYCTYKALIHFCKECIQPTSIYWIENTKEKKKKKELEERPQYKTIYDYKP